MIGRPMVCDITPRACATRLQGRPGDRQREGSRMRVCSRDCIADPALPVLRHTSPTGLPFAPRRYVATPVPRFVSFEVGTIDTLCGLGFFAALWRWAFVAVLRVETVIHVALEVAGAMEPRAGADEDPGVKPFRTVVAGGSAGVRSGIIVTIGTFGGYSDVDADLSLCFGGASREADSSNRS